MQTLTRSSSQTRRNRGFAAFLWLATAGVALPGAYLVATLPAAALSEIKQEDLPAPTTPAPDKAAPAEGTAPQAQDSQKAPSEAPDPDEGVPEQATPGSVHVTEDPNAPLPEIIYDVSKLPEPVQRVRQQLLDVAAAGDIEKLRALIGTGDDATQLSVAGLDEDPIAFLKEQSGDKNGEEVLAIMENLLNAGYVHLDPGTPEEIYAWPYFFAMPLDRLSARQRVELFKIVTAGDYEDMKSYGVYNFYRLGITPQGKWAFFVAGE
ncbi:hypothetical protein [Pseudaminobacter soli (ex Li et al. 2025)]|uniref:Fibronectin attachment protein n=1 Tax=Pseudaminobacter soli (ex Li et al. 2025) TaxID=1295366 RepID=A0A2P7SFL8_9HYPH|nr:hypothetical protein [Mesorhizobium soli]PSJ61273.1 hypothetical protein C7I85_09335 [Mesorhizobium soli]